MKHLTLALLGMIAMGMISCTNGHHSPKAALTESMDTLCLSANCVFTEEFLRENHQYIRFHYEYEEDGITISSDAVVHNPNCMYCDAFYK